MRRKPLPQPEPEVRPILHTGLTLLETADPLLLEELIADSRIGPLVAARLSDRMAIVTPGAVEAVLRQLLKTGHLPTVVE